MGSMSADEERKVYDAYRAAMGTDREDEAYQELRRALHVNEPPPGWSVEEYIRKEHIALGEHLAMRRIA
ncbi:MAG TPA: hypothetical protein VFO62_10735 [Candidatus Binatia bacterium]|nr:hypothetical protein [Candidatus Binatia bacterium]